MQISYVYSYVHRYLHRKQGIIQLQVGTASIRTYLPVPLSIRALVSLCSVWKRALLSYAQQETNPRWRLMPQWRPQRATGPRAVVGSLELKRPRHEGRRLRGRSWPLLHALGDAPAQGRRALPPRAPAGAAWSRREGALRPHSTSGGLRTRGRRRRRLFCGKRRT